MGHHELESDTAKMGRRDEEINYLRSDIEDMDRERHKLRSLVSDLDE